MNVRQENPEVLDLSREIWMLQPLPNRRRVQIPTYYPPQGGAGYKANPPQGVRKGIPVEGGPALPPPPPPAEMPLFIYTLTETAFPSDSDMIPTETIVATPFLVAGDSANAINPTETIGDSVAVTETES